MAQNAIVDWAPSGLRWKIERQFVLASINVLLRLKMQQSKTGTSAATYKLMNPNYYEIIEFFVIKVIIIRILIRIKHFLNNLNT